MNFFTIYQARNSKLNKNYFDILFFEYLYYSQMIKSNCIVLSIISTKPTKQLLVDNIWKNIFNYYFFISRSKGTEKLPREFGVVVLILYLVKHALVQSDVLYFQIGACFLNSNENFIIDTTQTKCFSEFQVTVRYG